MIGPLLDPALETPLLVYSEQRLEEACAALPGRVLYALKACYRPPVLRTLRGLGAGAEVMSALELDLALAAGFAGRDLLVNGLGRPAGFLEAACRARARIVLDDPDDLRRLLGVLGDRTVAVGVRLRPDLPADAAYARPSKLGLAWGSAALHEILETCRRDPRLRLDLLHVHAASQETGPEMHLHLLEALREPVAELRREFPLRLLDLGGGFESLPPEQAAALFGTLAEAFRAGFPDLELVLEPGRYLVNRAGFLVTTVMSVKGSDLVVDAGTNTLMPHREATYRVLHPAAGPVGPYALVDGITSLTSTLLADACFAEPPRVGDRLVLGNCGAYTSALAQFWAYEPLPTAFLRRDGTLVPDLTREALSAARRLLLEA